jgi:signal transduction histidine kinase
MRNGEAFRFGNNHGAGCRARQNRLRITSGGAYLMFPVCDSSSADESSTREWALEQRVAELERALVVRDEVIATLGHELRNPLSPVYFQLSGVIDLIDAGTPPEPEWMKARLVDMRRRFRAFLATLDRLLEASSPGGALDLQLEEVDLAHVVREVCAGMQGQLEAARTELRLAAHGPVRGLWDRVRVQQIAWNLISNAVRYGAGTPIDVVVDRDDDRASLVVRDQGIGIAPEDLVRIFERYERADENRRAGGFGLGLWIVRRLTSAMGGTIAVDSRPGEGATFTVTLPGSPDPD